VQRAALDQSWQQRFERGGTPREKARVAALRMGGGCGGCWCAGGHLGQQLLLGAALLRRAAGRRRRGGGGGGATARPHGKSKARRAAAAKRLLRRARQTTCSRGREADYAGTAARAAGPEGACRRGVHGCFLFGSVGRSSRALSVRRLLAMGRRRPLAAAVAPAPPSTFGGARTCFSVGVVVEKSERRGTVRRGSDAWGVGGGGGGGDGDGARMRHERERMLSDSLHHLTWM